MMTLSRIDIRHLRILDAVSIEPGEALNVVVGANGAGKTSLLEGIYLLGRGRSFRSTDPKTFIREGEQCTEVTGWGGGGSSVVGGIRRCLQGTEIRIGGEPVNRMSDLARVFPVQLVTPRSHELLERGPDIRRRFLDWGVFHVEPAFLGLTTRYQRVLRQRNAALKTAPASASAWDEQLASLGDQIAGAREAYLGVLTERYRDVAGAIGPAGEVTFSLARGWPAGELLGAALSARRRADSQQGYTSVGPHRADLRIRVNGVPAESRLSRGQQKTLVLSLMLAQLKTVGELGPSAPILLADDLGAELDEEARVKVTAYLRAMGIQVFVTSLDEDTLGCSADDKLFHVEHGRVGV